MACSAEDMIFRNNAFQRGVNHLHWRCRKDVEIENISLNSAFENLVQQLNVAFEANALSYFIQMFLAHFIFKFRVVQQEVGEFRSLLHQINFRHSLCFALKLGGRNSDQFGEHVTGIVKGERLIEIARENVAFQGFIYHMVLRFLPSLEGP